MELLDINVELKNASKQITEEQIDQFIETIDEHKRILYMEQGVQV